MDASAEFNPWLVLDDPQEWRFFSREDPQGRGQWVSSLSIDGMHCAACGTTLESALCAVPGVEAVDLHVASGRAQVRWSEALTRPSLWLAAVQGAGYRPWPVSGEQVQLQRDQQRAALWRWLVAALCMMQVMMYSVPSYMAGPGEMAADMVQLMRWAGWVICLPLVFFSCGPFFSAAWRDLVKGRISMDLPVALGIGITFAVSSAATFDPNGWWSGEVWFDSLSMFVFFLLTGRWLETRARARTSGLLDTLMRRLPESADCRQGDGSFRRVPVRRLVAGDTVRVRAGEAFPGDGLLESGSTQVDESLLTGESRPLLRQTGQAVLAGSYNLTGIVELRLAGVGEQTRYAQIVGLMEQASLDKPRLGLLADRIAKPFLVFVLLAAGATAVSWWSANPAHALMTAVAVLVVTCPCALSLATPAAMLASAGALARGGVLLRNLNVLEALAGVDTVIFDKTGTLTSNTLEIAGVAPREGLSDAGVLALAATLARASLHPVSRTLAQSSAEVTPDVTDIREVPGQGVEGLQGGHTVRFGSAAFCAAVPPRDSLSRAYLADADGVMASFVLVENLREQAVDAVAALLRQGLRVEILSGDRSQAVGLVAERLKLGNARGDCSVGEKLAHLQRLQSAGHRVLMVGDGINDGPVLAAADVSVAVGNAVPLAQAQADCIMVHGNLLAVSELVEQGVRTMRVVRQNLIWAVAYNALGVPLAIAGYLPAWLASLGMALSSLLVVLNASRLARKRKIA